MSFLEEKISAKPVATVIFLSLVLLLSGNWILPLMDRDEPRFAEASREMLQRGDYIIPWFNGQYRFDKPPLIYWCQAACYAMMGENEFAARLPSALFATATAVLLVLWGKRLGKEQAGLFAGLMTVTCLQVLIHARLAVADMPMVFFVAAAFWSGWEMTRPTPAPRPIWWWTFYLSLALGFLAKGPVAWLPLAGLLLARGLKPQRFHLPRWPTVLGGLLTLFIVGLWGVPALARTQGQFFLVGIGHHVLFRSLGIMDGHGSSGWLGFIVTLPLYALTFFFSFCPWAFSVPRTLRAWWPGREQDTLGWYLLLQAAVIFAVFTLVRTKLPHYTLPAFPALSLWLALQVLKRPAAFEWLALRVAVMAVLALILTLGFFQIGQRYFVARQLWKQAAPLCSPDMDFATAGFGEPSPIWEFRREVTNYAREITLQQAPSFLHKPGPRLLIFPTKDFTAELRNVATNTVNLRAEGLDTARFRRLDLTALIKTNN